jgi:hypothetical protein
MPSFFWIRQVFFSNGEALTISNAMGWYQVTLLILDFQCNIH